MSKASRTRVWIQPSVLLLACLLLADCNRDPRMGALQEAVDLMARIVRSTVVVEAVRRADPQSRPTTAARAALSGGVVANFAQPPRDIAILDGDRATQPWCVILIGDDANKQVRIEGYGADVAKPAIVEEVEFPPR